jgi:hypothetical protein
VWILQNCWDDTGVWIDTDFWNDVCIIGVYGTLAATESPDTCLFIGSVDFAVGGKSTGHAGWREKHHKEHIPHLPPRQYIQVHPITLKEAAAHLASAGGNARAASLSATRRTQIATNAANTRWK